MFPYPDTGQSIAVDANDALFVNACGDGGGGGCGITVYPSKSIVPSGTFFIDNGTPSGALLIDREKQIVVGDPYDDAILAKQLPPRRTAFAVSRRNGRVII